MHLGVAPDVYDRLTLAERDAIIHEANRKNRRR